MSECNFHPLSSALYDLNELVTQMDDQPDGNTQSFGRITVVVPIRDEHATIRSLCAGITRNVLPGYEFEIILVDDGSRDGSWEIIQSLSQEQPYRIRGIRLRHGAGKSVALAAGFRAAQGDVLLTMDGDLQDDPEEIPRFLAKLREGYDLVCGWKRVRHDPWHKVLPSRVFNRLASYFGGVHLHDHNCGFKCYRADVARSLVLHGDLHRMIPSLLGTQGYRCTEIEVRHHPRRAGHSKYGWRRILRGFCDVLTVGFLRSFRQRPAHLFSTVALGYLAISGILAGAFILKGSVVTEALAMLMGSALFAALAVSTWLVGLLAELVIRGPLQMDAEIPVLADTGQPRHPNPTDAARFTANGRAHTAADVDTILVPPRLPAAVSGI